MLPNWPARRRYPWVHAGEPRDCGAAVFASVARSYGCHFTLEQARSLVDTDRNGTTLAGLRDGGRAIGLDARPAHATYDALGKIPLPAICHLNGQEGHYVVLYRWLPDAVVILDPNRGVRRLRRAAFETDWSGYLVEFAPTPALRPRKQDFRPLAVFLALARGHVGLLALALVCALLATALGWAAAFFLQTLVDQILPRHLTGLLVTLGVALVALSGLQGLLQFGRLGIAAVVGQRIHLEYGERFIAQLLRLPAAVFDSRCVAGLVLRSTQIDQIQQAITEAFVGLITDGSLFLAALAVIFTYDPTAALIALGAAPLMIFVAAALNGTAYDAQYAQLARLEDFGSHMVDTFDSLRTVKTFTAEERYRRLLVGKLGRLAAARREGRIALALPVVWSVVATSLITAGVLWYGGHRLLEGQISAGGLLVLFSMVTFALGPVQRLPATVLALSGALIALERLEEIRTLPAERERVERPQALPSVRGQVTFDHVRFGYRRHHPVLKDVSFTIEPGETVAIVGETGSGKTSLANLIAGFYLPTAGEVAIDGVSTRSLDPDALRRSISAVFQDPKLLQQSIRENITMLADRPLDAVKEASRLASADAFISALLNGYDSQVARGGDNFSSGQAQRIALARALLKDAPILILDEATSNLDGKTEYAILQALAASHGERTTIVIAHRLSTVLLADRILVMDDGEIVEAGTHHELLGRRGRYYDLFHRQILEVAPRERSEQPAALSASPDRRDWAAIPSSLTTIS